MNKKYIISLIVSLVCISIRCVLWLEENQAKRGYGLNNIKARLAQTGESWVNAILFVLNLKNLVEQMEKYGGIFLSLLKKIYNCIKNWFKFEINRKAIKILTV